MRVVGPLALAVGLSSCGGSSGLSLGSSCDTDALRKLSNELAAMEPREARRAVWPPAKAACGDALPTIYDYIFARAPSDQRATSLDTEPDKRYAKLNELACPKGREVAGPAIAEAPVDQRGLAAFTACEFGRFGVLSVEEVSGSTTPSWGAFGFHALMLQDGLTPEEAKPITRALYHLERRNEAMIFFADIEALPVAAGSPMELGLGVTVTPTELLFNERKHASITEGKLVGQGDPRQRLRGLFDAVTEEVEMGKTMAEQTEREWEGIALLAMDPGTSYETVQALVSVLKGAGMERIDLVVESQDGLDVGTVPLDPVLVVPDQRPLVKDSGNGIDFEDEDELAENRFAQYMNEPDEQEPPAEDQPEDEHDDLFAQLAHREEGPASKDEALTVELTPTTLTAGWSGRRPTAPQKVDNFEQLGNFATAMRAGHPEHRRVILSATPDTDLQRLVSTLEALRGPNCSTSGVCHFEEFTLVKDGAHTHLKPAAAQPGAGGLIFKGADQLPLGHLGRSALAGNQKKAPQVRPEKHTVLGSMDADIIRRIVRAHINELRSCYNQGLVKNPNLTGRLEISFVINKLGKVSEASVKSSDLDDAHVGTCATKAFRRWKFPKPAGGGVVKVTYPFSMVPG